MTTGSQETDGAKPA